jgi:hypothetical protein
VRVGAQDVGKSRHDALDSLLRAARIRLAKLLQPIGRIGALGLVARGRGLAIGDVLAVLDEQILDIASSARPAASSPKLSDVWMRAT